MNDRITYPVKHRRDEKKKNTSYKSLKSYFKFNNKNTLIVSGIFLELLTKLKEIYRSAFGNMNAIKRK